MMKCLHKVTRHSLLIILWLCGCVAFSGCTTPGLFSKWTHRNDTPKATATNPALRILCMWQPADGVGVDEKPARGVAGQIFFFTRGGVTPVEVDGDVRIFLFDDQGSDEQQGTPLDQFDFVKGAWKAQLVGTQFGSAYQLFVPYSRKGHHQTELAVRVRLSPPNGPVIFSDMAKVVLPGYEKKPAADENTTASNEPTKNVGGELAVGSAASASAAAADDGSRPEITPERIQETYLQILAERNNRPSSPNAVPARKLAAERPVTPKISSSSTSSSVVGRIQVQSNSPNLMAAQEELDNDPVIGDKLAKRATRSR